MADAYLLLHMLRKLNLMLFWSFDGYHLKVVADCLTEAARQLINGFHVVAVNLILRVDDFSCVLQKPLRLQLGQQMAIG